MGLLMAEHIRLERKSYRGKNPRKRDRVAEYNHAAEVLEDYINKQVELQTEERQVYLYSKIAADLYLDVKLVARILFSIDCGSNGFTVYKSERSS